MADDTPDNPDLKSKETAPAPVSETRPGNIDSSYLADDLLLHLQALCEQFQTHCKSCDRTNWQDTQPLLEDDLSRIVNDLVLLEKSALSFVARELLKLVQYASTPNQASQQVIGVIEQGAQQLLSHVGFMVDGDYQYDSALSLIPLVNDCRASTQSSYLSDALMAAVGMELADNGKAPGTSKQVLSAECTKLAEHAMAKHAIVDEQIADWQNNRDASAKPLLKALSSFVDLTRSMSTQHSSYCLFRSLVIIVQACEQGELEKNPGVCGLFSQLSEALTDYAATRPSHALVDAALLRNCLYYVAQTSFDASAHMRNKFRLGRFSSSNHPAYKSTPTIGFDYQVINAMRQAVIAESTDLAGWLDVGLMDRVDYFKLVRLRLKLKQFEQVLAIVACQEGLTHLSVINEYLQRLDRKSEIEKHLCDSVTLGFTKLEASLDRSARKSIEPSRAGGVNDADRRDIYVDLARDACLLAAGVEVRAIGDDICELLSSEYCVPIPDNIIVERLVSLDNALQVLPLPEISPLVVSLCETVSQLSTRFQSEPAQRSSVNKIKLRENTDVVPELRSVFKLMDLYFCSALQPQPIAEDLLSQACEKLDDLKAALVSSTLSGDAPEDEEDAGSLTLNVNDELLLEPMLEPFLDDTVDQDATLKMVFHLECDEHLKMLSDAVRCALKPSANSDSQLPNEKMLRALHTVTSSAQAVGAGSVLGIAQPLQRASLALHREGRCFDASQTRYINDLLTALHARLAATQLAQEVDESVVEIESQLGAFISEAVTGIRQSAANADVLFNTGTELNSLGGVFSDEAAQLLEQLWQVISRPGFDSGSLNHAFGILHTLKGSARMAGEKAFSQSAHVLESDLQSLDDLHVQHRLLKSTYPALQQQIMHRTEHGSEAPRLDSHATYTRNESLSNDSENTESPYEERALTSATDLGATQSRLSTELKNLRHMYQEHKAATVRWKRLVQSGSETQSPAISEVTADMQASITLMGDALRRIEVEQQQAVRTSASLQQTLLNSRLVKFGSIRPKLLQVVDDAAAQCSGVQVELRLSGGELMLDRTMFNSISAPLEHLIRNAVVHGYNSQGACAKEPNEAVGVVSVSARIEGSELILGVRDDGCGVDVDNLNQQRSVQGLLSIRSNKELQELLFSRGFSSASNTDAIAGHGLGLTAVKAAIASLNGRIALDAYNVDGFSISLFVPQSTVVKRLVLVKLHHNLYGFPIEDVQSVQVSQALASDTSHKLPYQSGRFSLRHLIGTDDEAHDMQDNKPCIIINRANQTYAIEVDKVVGYREIVTQPIGVQLSSLEVYSAGGVTSDGQAVLAIDVDALLQRSATDAVRSKEQASRHVRPKVLVVDDSHTCRKKTCDSLKQWGFDVQGSRNGLDALEQLGESPPELIIVDLEMPLLNGFGLVDRLKDVYSENVPRIIMMSVNPESSAREKAANLGVSGFLPKPFDDVQLRSALQMAGLNLPDLTIA